MRGVLEAVLIPVSQQEHLCFYVQPNLSKHQLSTPSHAHVCSVLLDVKGDNTLEEKSECTDNSLNQQQLTCTSFCKMPFLYHQGLEGSSKCGWAKALLSQPSSKPIPIPPSEHLQDRSLLLPSATICGLLHSHSPHGRTRILWSLLLMQSVKLSPNCFATRWGAQQLPLPPQQLSLSFSWPKLLDSQRCSRYAKVPPLSRPFFSAFLLPAQPVYCTPTPL